MAETTTRQLHCEVDSELMRRVREAALPRGAQPESTPGNGAALLLGWINEALRGYAAGLAHARLVVPIDPPMTREDLELAPEDRATLLELAERYGVRGSDQRVLNVWLAMLAEAGWPLSTVVCPVLGISQQAVQRRVGLGREVLNGDGADEVLALIPEVPLAPNWPHPVPAAEGDREDLRLRRGIDPDALAQVTERATVEGITLTQAIQRAFEEHLRSLRDEAPVPWAQAVGNGAQARTGGKTRLALVSS